MQRYASMPPLPKHIVEALRLRRLLGRVIARPGDHDEELDDDDFDETEIADAWRARCATANRVLTVLKAALNHTAGRRHRKHWHAQSPWDEIEPFRKVDPPEIRYLEVSKRDDLIRHAEGAFRDLCVGALVTGCRYGELTRLRAQDFHPSTATVFVSESKGGRPRQVVLQESGIRLFSRLTDDLEPGQRIFRKQDGEPWRKGHQVRPLLRACEAAKISPAISFHILRHTYATLLWINGTRIEVIAELLGHADIRITQRHYAKIPRRVVVETVRTALPPIPADLL